MAIIIIGKQIICQQSIVAGIIIYTCAKVVKIKGFRERSAGKLARCDLIERCQRLYSPSTQPSVIKLARVKSLFNCGESGDF